MQNIAGHAAAVVCMIKLRKWNVRSREHKNDTSLLCIDEGAARLR